MKEFLTAPVRQLHEWWELAVCNFVWEVNSGDALPELKLEVLMPFPEGDRLPAFLSRKLPELAASLDF